jgi:hypothetical protein
MSAAWNPFEVHQESLWAVWVRNLFAAPEEPVPEVEERQIAPVSGQSGHWSAAELSQRGLSMMQAVR